MWLSQHSMFIVRLLPLTFSAPLSHSSTVHYIMWIVIKGFKGLVAYCHSLFIIYCTYNGTHIHGYIAFDELHSSFPHCSPLRRGPPLWCRAQNRTRGRFAAAQYATVWALSYPDWATPYPVKLSSTLLSYAVPYLRYATPYTVKKVCGFPVPSRDVTYQTYRLGTGKL